MPMPRPDMRSHFRWEIDGYVHGMMATRRRVVPRNVAKIEGTVCDLVITVTMLDGTQYRWSGARYASRKVHGCYAPLMPHPEP